MEVTINVRKLMSTLESMNPGADFTQTKAYLFDLAIGDGGSEPHTAPRRAEPRPAPVVEEEPEQLPLPLPEVYTSPARPAKRVMVTTNHAKQGKPSRDEKAAKRAEMERLANIPTRDLLAQITGQQEGKREGNQFINEGMESHDQGGDLEIG